jgi:nucleotide-binding universal stress UspA family protein
VGARLVIVHSTEEGSEDEARRRLEDLLQAVGCEAEIQIATGRVKDAILEAASRSAADALIVGRPSSGGSSGRLRDLTYSLVRDSPCPVLSV